MIVAVPSELKGFREAANSSVLTVVVPTATTRLLWQQLVTSEDDCEHDCRSLRVCAPDAEGGRVDFGENHVPRKQVTDEGVRARARKADDQRG